LQPTDLKSNRSARLLGGRMSLDDAEWSSPSVVAGTNETPAAVEMYRITKKLTGLWPDLASGFPYAPDRELGTVEGPLARLHVFRNRLAHHQRV
jgi:hypothetical protein